MVSFWQLLILVGDILGDAIEVSNFILDGWTQTIRTLLPRVVLAKSPALALVNCILSTCTFFLNVLVVALFIYSILKKARREMGWRSFKPSRADLMHLIRVASAIHKVVMIIQGEKEDFEELGIQVLMLIVNTYKITKYTVIICRHGKNSDVNFTG